MAAQPGHTKDLQSVQLERGMRIVDSPGVVFDDEDEKAGNILLRNVVKVEDVNDPIAVGRSLFVQVKFYADLNSRGNLGANTSSHHTKIIQFA